MLAQGQSIRREKQTKFLDTILPVWVESLTASATDMSTDIYLALSFALWYSEYRSAKYSHSPFKVQKSADRTKDSQKAISGEDNKYQLDSKDKKYIQS